MPYVSPSLGGRYGPEDATTSSVTMSALRLTLNEGLCERVAPVFH